MNVIRILWASALVILAPWSLEARSISSSSDDASISGVIPSPNQVYGDAMIDDIQRTSTAATRVPASVSATVASRPRSISHQQQEPQEQSAESSNEAAAPIYVSPFARADLEGASQYEHSQESSHAPPNYAPKPSPSDLKASASYGKSELEDSVR